MRTTWLKALTAASALALVATGCGSDSGSDSGSGGGSGEAIKITVISQLDAPNFAFPEIEDMVKAATKQVNDAGGIGDRQVEVTYCNDQGDANAASACARQAVSDKAVAVLGTFSLFAGTTTPILEAAGIPYVGDTFLSPEDGTSDVAFPVNGGTPAGGAAVGLRFLQEGCTKAGAIGFDQAASDAYVSFVNAGLKTGGGSIETTAHVAPGTPDYAPALATLTSAGVQCIFISLPAGEAAKFMGAVAQSGEKVLIGTGVSTLPQQVIGSLPPAVTEGVVLTGTGYQAADDVAPVNEMKEQAVANGASEEAANANYSPQAWGGAQILYGALKTIDGDITAKSAMDALSSITEPANDMFGPFSTTEPSSAKGLPRLFNQNALNYTVHNGVITLDSPDFIDTSKALAG
jgi:ABC-type branched-subunit amino acid transport system substrate-binding protein